MASTAATGGGQPLPLTLIAQAVPRLSRHDLEALTECLIDRLDRLEPDPDVERNGDELDGTGAEDDFCPQNEDWKGEPGCPLADPDLAVDDGACDGEAAEFGWQPVTLNAG